MSFVRQTISLGSISLLLLSCVSNSKKSEIYEQETIVSFDVHSRKARAHRYYLNHDFASALTQWKILQTISANGTEYRKRILAMEALIKRRIKKQLIIGRNAMKRKNYKGAELAYLKVLAMNPVHQTALQMLRKIEATRRIKKHLNNRRYKK